jgi:hypothetical protein
VLIVALAAGLLLVRQRAQWDRIGDGA